MSERKLRWVRCWLVCLGLAACNQPYQTIPPHTHEECSQAGQIMGSANPPSGWELEAGVWGTNADRDESTTLTGQATVKLYYDAAESAPVLWSPWIPVGASNAATTSKVNKMAFSHHVRFLSSSTTAGHTITITLYVYDKDRAELANYSMHSAIATTANEWEMAGIVYPFVGEARWHRVKITKANQDFDVYIDSEVAQKVPACAYSNGWTTPGQTVPRVTWTTVDSKAYSGPNGTSGASKLNVESVYGGGTNGLTVYTPGVYLVTAMVTYTDLLDAETGALRITWTDINGSAQTSAAVWNQAAKANGKLSLPISLLVDIETNNNVINLETYHDGDAGTASGDRTLGEDGYFSAVRISD